MEPSSSIIACTIAKVTEKRCMRLRITCLLLVPPCPCCPRWWLEALLLAVLTGCNQTQKLLRSSEPQTATSVGTDQQSPSASTAAPIGNTTDTQAEAESIEASPTPRSVGSPGETLFPPSDEVANNMCAAPPPGTITAASIPAVWGIVGLRGFPYGQTMASNGNEYNQLFSLDLNFNIWLWRAKRLYLYGDSRFWGQKAAPGITNPTQGAFDFSKREYDLTSGFAWNYAGFWELRAFAYSYNNLNRGTSAVSPNGFNDGVGLENRYYLNPTYANLGTPIFDKARATFLSLGFYPTKSMVDGQGKEFKPGPFARSYLIWELYGPKCYLFTDDTFIADRSFRPALFSTDSGLALRPFNAMPRLEFRLGTEDTFDLQNSDLEVSAYISLRYIY
jgi:hypothetical protein